jgi:hypothetical protein
MKKTIIVVAAILVTLILVAFVAGTSPPTVATQTTLKSINTSITEVTAPGANTFVPAPVSIAQTQSQSATGLDNYVIMGENYNGYAAINLTMERKMIRPATGRVALMPSIIHAMNYFYGPAPYRDDLRRIFRT